VKVSIITATYNSDKTIIDCLQSIYSQTYKNFEVIVIDGLSSDNTLELITSFSTDVRILSEKDGGIYDAMNKGIKLANGDIVAILNSDDLFYSNDILANVITAFESDNNLDIIYGDIVYVDQLNTNKIVRKWFSKEYSDNYFEDGHVPPHPSLFLKKRVYKKAGFFNLEFKLASDYEFMLRIFKKHDFKSRYLNKYFVKMRLGGATNNSFFSIAKQNLEILNAWKINNLNPPFLFFPKRFLLRLKQFL
jgi:glycosyltransferase involved in cell wall biosynthesis